MRIRFILSETFKGLSRNLAMTVSVILVAFAGTALAIAIIIAATILS